MDWGKSLMPYFLSDYDVYYSYSMEDTKKATDKLGKTSVAWALFEQNIHIMWSKDPEESLDVLGRKYILI